MKLPRGSIGCSLVQLLSCQRSLGSMSDSPCWQQLTVHAADGPVSRDCGPAQPWVSGWTSFPPLSPLAVWSGFTPDKTLTGGGEELGDSAEPVVQSFNKVGWKYSGMILTPERLRQT